MVVEHEEFGMDEQLNEVTTGNELLVDLVCEGGGVKGIALVGAIYFVIGRPDRKLRRHLHDELEDSAAELHAEGYQSTDT